jgi:hypothetical protein
MRLEEIITESERIPDWNEMLCHNKSSATVSSKTNNLNPGRKPDKPMSWVRPVLIAAGIITVGIILYKGYQYFQEEKQRKDIAKED